MYIFSHQNGACKNARQTQGPRGHARRDGTDPHCHPGRRPAHPRSVETKTSKVLQRKAQNELQVQIYKCYNVQVVWIQYKNYLVGKQRQMCFCSNIDGMKGICVDKVQMAFFHICFFLLLLCPMLSKALFNSHILLLFF